MASTSYRQQRRRSVAWVYYAILAIIALVGTFASHTPAGIIPTALLAAYSVYIFRGGRFVIWIW